MPGDRPSATRGLYLQGSACCSEARVLFKCFPFGECGNLATLVVWRFQKDRRNPLIPYIPKKLQVPWKLPALFLIQTMFFILKLYQ